VHDKGQSAPLERERFVSVGTKLAGVTVLVLAIVAAGVFVEVSRSQRSQLLRSKELAATMVARLFSAGAAAPLTFGDDRGAKEQVSLLAANDQVVYGALWSLDQDNPSQAPQKLGEMRRGAFASEPVPSAHSDLRTMRGADWILVETPVLEPTGNQVGVAQVALSLAQENDAIRQSQRRTLWASLATALGLAFVLVALSRSLIIRPLERLAAAAKRLERGEAVQVAIESRDEVGRLARGFDAMTRAIAIREHRISERNRDLRRVLDNAADGFLTVDVSGNMSDERSGVLDQWFGPPRASGSFLDYMDDVAPETAPSIRLGWEELRENIVPLELVLHQLPHRFEREGRYFELDYRPILTGDELEQILVVIRDVTQQIERERAEQGQREMAALVKHMLADRAGFQGFFREAAALISAVERDDGSDPARLKRTLHTLKGNSALFGLQSIARFCHDLEQRVIADPDSCTKADRARLRELWSVACGAYELLGGDTHGENIELDPDEHNALLQALRDRMDYAMLTSIVSAWKFERASVRLARASEQLRSLALRLGKGDVEVVCDVVPAGLRLPQQRWSPFWTAFAHVLRNTMDHGVETPPERTDCGKLLPAKIVLSIRAGGEGVELSISDDGRGIDWERIRARAIELGLPHATEADLVEALYADGVTSRSSATETSGRGIGMGAVRETVRSLGGRMSVETQRGFGTTLCFVLPNAMMPRHFSMAPPSAASEGRRGVSGGRSIATGAA
jgi:two-component system chemotaxis sensor kinase CheA